MNGQPAYLDNNVVSAIAKDDTAGESDAIDRLLEAHERGSIRLITSELTLDEIKKYAGPWRKGVERTFRLLGKIPVARWDELVGIRRMHIYTSSRTLISAPVFQNDSLYDGLLKLGLETPDARHVFVCAKHGCTIFLTCDGGVLSRAMDIRRLSSVSAQKPSELVATLAIG